MAFNSKNLHYDKSEPSFLRKLRGEFGNDRANFQAARPTRDRLKNDDDDGPAMVDEEGASVSKEDYEAMINGQSGDSKSKDPDLEASHIKPDIPHSEISKETANEKQKTAEVGATKKRKQAKVVGEEAQSDEVTEKEVKPTKKPKKKVKLSFEEPDG